MNEVGTRSSDEVTISVRAYCIRAALLTDPMTGSASFPWYVAEVRLYT